MILVINTNGIKHCLGIYQTDTYEVSESDHLAGESSDMYEKCWEVVNNKRRDILCEIDKFLEKNQIKLSNITKIAVYQGPGSFTSLRVGIAIANTLGWSLNIPVIGVKGTKYNQELSILDIIIKSKKITSINKLSHFDKPVEPYYETSLK